MIRKSILVLLAALVSLTAGCTTRYQDMLRERDERIRELSGDIARLRNENEELQRRELPTPQNAAAPREQGAGVIGQIQDEVGGDAVVSYRRGRISIGVEDSVTFDSGSTKLKGSANRVLDRVAQVLRSRFAGHRFYVEGHTDSDPIQKTKDRFRSNRHLSAERADSVAAYLIQQGVPEANIVVVGYGQFDPVDAKTKAKNRRVEIVVGDAM
ncbi:MAG: OmpA family protein [Planctomycetes bacterium]|nr:OmpA family protein [Planctomycetota bacterium]